jgi:CubicO group peptidase (beta-lactamase class C family)
VAVGVLAGDEVVFAAGFGLADPVAGRPADAETRFRIGSVTKLFTATAVLLLAEEGKLRLDDPLERFLPGLVPRGPFPYAEPIRLEHLLTHTSGLPREGSFPYWTTHIFPSREEWLARLPTEEVRNPPGSVYRYSNLGMALLGEVVARASGESWGSFVERAILKPLGMNRSIADPGPEPPPDLARAFLRRRPDGQRAEVAYYDLRGGAPAGAMISTVSDLLRFAKLLLEAHFEGGPSQSLPAVSRRTLAEMLRPRYLLPNWEAARGLGFLVSRREGQTYVGHGGWVGGHRADFVLDPSRKVAAVALTNADDASPWPFSRRALELFGRVVASLRSDPKPEPPAPPANWKPLLGRYTDPWGWETEVLILDGKLTLYDRTYPPEDNPEERLIRLQPTADPWVFRTEDGDSVRFELDGKGQVVRLYRNAEYLTPVPPGF